MLIFSAANTYASEWYPLHSVADVRFRISSSLPFASSQACSTLQLEWMRGPLSAPSSPLYDMGLMIEGKLFPFIRSIVTQVLFLTFVNHIIPFFFFIFPFVGLISEDQIGSRRRTRQSRSVFHHPPGREF